VLAPSGGDVAFGDPFAVFHLFCGVSGRVFLHLLFELHIFLSPNCFTFARFVFLRRSSMSKSHIQTHWEDRVRAVFFAFFLLAIRSSFLGDKRTTFVGTLILMGGARFLRA
jgi:hypothetical protein